MNLYRIISDPRTLLIQKSVCNADSQQTKKEK